LSRYSVQFGDLLNERGVHLRDFLACPKEAGLTLFQIAKVDGKLVDALDRLGAG
jgi:hypothetical protein